MTHILTRGDTASVWTSQNPVLMARELGLETDTLKAKWGDGATPWNSLPYSIQPTPDVSLLAPKASPVFTGNPTAPTPATADNDTSVATTAFVKAQGYATSASPTLTGDPKAPTPAIADNDTSIATTAFVVAAIAAERLVSNPIGTIKVTIVNTNPGTYLGGTWVAWGSGRVPVGVDAAQTEFDTVEETGGAKTVTLTSAQVPGIALAMRTTTGGNFDAVAGSGAGGVTNTGGPIVSNGGGGAHTNLQPYITCYMWKRTV